VISWEENQINQGEIDWVGKPKPEKDGEAFYLKKKKGGMPLSKKGRGESRVARGACP